MSVIENLSIDILKSKYEKFVLKANVGALKIQDCQIALFSLYSLPLDDVEKNVKQKVDEYICILNAYQINEMN